MQSFSLVFRAALLLGSATLAMPALAQQSATDPRPSEESTNRDQIVVTATRTTRSSV